MDVDFAFLCDAAQESGGKVHALGIGIDGVFAPALPASQSIVLVAQLRYWASEAGTHPLHVRLIDADGHAVTAMDGEITFGAITEPTSVVRLLLTLAALPLNHYGDYAVVVSIADEDVARLPLRVMAPRS